MVVIKGTYVACYKHATELAASDVAFRDLFREAIQKFFPCDFRSACRWARGERLPNWANALKMRFFLSKIGYEIDELKVIDPLLFELADLIVHDVVSFESVVLDIGKGEHGETLEILLGKKQPSEEFMKGVSVIVESYRDLLEEAKKSKTVQGLKTYKCPDQSRISKDPHVLSEEKVQTEKTAACKDVEIQHQRVIKEFVELIARVNGLAEMILSDEYSAEERHAMRKLAGENVHIASNNMDRLTSEKSREMIDPYRTGIRK